MPAELINEHPAVACMTALELGALWALSHAFWRAGCLPIPNEEATISVLAKCHTRRWYDVRAKVLPVWNAIYPKLATVYAERVTRYETRSAITHRTNEARRASKAASQMLRLNDSTPGEAGVKLAPGKRDVSHTKRNGVNADAMAD